MTKRATPAQTAATAAHSTQWSRTWKNSTDTAATTAMLAADRAWTTNNAVVRNAMSVSTKASMRENEAQDVRERSDHGQEQAGIDRAEVTRVTHADCLQYRRRGGAYGGEKRKEQSPSHAVGPPQSPGNSSTLGELIFRGRARCLTI